LLQLPSTKAHWQQHLKTRECFSCLVTKISQLSFGPLIINCTQKGAKNIGKISHVVKEISHHCLADGWV
jgi:hypothetical protein